MTGWLAAIVAGGAGASIAARSPRNAIRRCLAAGLICIGVATAAATPVTRALTRPLDVPPYLVNFVRDLLALGAAFCALALLTHARTRAEAVQRYIRYEATSLVAVGVAMFGLATAHPGSTVQLATTVGLDRSAVAYQALYLLSTGSGMISFGWLVGCRVRAREHARIRLARGTTFAAAAVGLVWVAWDSFHLLAPGAGQHLLVDPDVGSELLGALLVVLISVGCTGPPWAGWFARRRARVRARRARAGLMPLWRVVTAAVPEVALCVDNRSDVEYALYRLIIEIRDAQLVLRALAESDIEGWARTAASRHGIPPGRHTALVVEAAELAAALRAQAAGTGPVVRSGTTASHREDFVQPDSDLAGRATHAAMPDVCAEARWLITLSRALNTSPVVAELLRDGR